jgi:folate-binding protein YgfZ
MIILLKNRALLKLSGGDVLDFLQGQFSNDIKALQGQNVQLNAYCQHQGKIIALIWVMKKEGDFYLSFPADLLDLVRKRLQMFVMMSEVILADVSAQFEQLGIIDEDFEGAFRLNTQQSVALVENSTGLTLADEAFWADCCIQHKLPEVYLKTSEKFVPQLLNLDIDEVGVSFSKGCYPGQEVVARLHYLGKSKRRLEAFECDNELNVGDELIVSASNSTKASGMVVRRVKLSSKSLCLATIEVAHKDEKITLNKTQITLIRIHND